MIFGKYINRYYLKHAPVLLLGILSLLTVDYIQLLIPELYRLVINGVNLGQVVVDGQTMAFTKEVLFQHICLPMIYIVVLMVIGRFLWRVCFFGSAVRVAADLREQMFDHSRQLSQQYYQINKVGNLMSLYTNDLDTIQECFGDGILMFFDASVLGILALVKMWRMDIKLTLLALIPAAVMFAIGTVMSQVMTKRWEERQQAFSDLSDFAQENFSGIAVIKAFVKELKELIESHGGKVTGSVTSKTNYLINNDAMSNSTKNKKARELGIPILSEEDFLKRLLREDPQHTVRRFLVQVNEAGELVSAEGILGESLGQIVRKRIRKRVVTLEIPMLGAARRVELAIRVKGDENREQVAGI